MRTETTHATSIRITTCCLLAILTFGLAAPAQADVLALYDVEGVFVDDDTFNHAAFDSVDTELLTDATRLSNGGGLTGGGSGQFVISNALFDTSDSGSPGLNLAEVNTASRATAIAAGDFFEFTLESNGKIVTYESITFFTDQFDATARTKVDITYQIGAGAAQDAAVGLTPPGGNAPVVELLADFADFTTADDVTFRFVMYGSGPIDNAGTRFDDITLNGSIVPAPAALPAGLALILAMAARRRRA